MEAPILELKRGETYIFDVRAGETHPFYITESEKGGNDLGEKEKIYAGGEASHGTASKPFSLTWTVPGDAPDLVWYGCYAHQKLGYKVQITGEKTAVGTTSSSSASASTLHSLAAALISLLVIVL
jgi:hypothetical protein